MKNNALFKDALRTVGRTRTRFFSIVLIVALGISFFAGFSATAPFMRASIWEYYNLTDAADIRIISTIGLTSDDVETIAGIDGVQQVQGERFVDGVVDVDGKPITDLDGSRLSVRAYSLPVNDAIAFSNAQIQSGGAGVEGVQSVINCPQLLEGTWPRNANECLADSSALSTPEEFQIGTKVIISGDGTDISSSLENDEYTIVGIIRTPLYVDYERGSTTIGTGKLGTFLLLPDENFKLDYFSAINVKITGADKLEPYSEEYENLVAPFVDFIDSFSFERASKRAAKLKSEYGAKVEAAESEYATTKAEVEQALLEGEQQVKEILELNETGDERLAQYKEEYNQKAAEAQQTIESSKLQHSDGYAEYESKLKQYTEAKALVAKYEGSDVTYRTSLTEYNVASTAVTTLTSTVDYLEHLVATTRAAVDQLNADQSTSVGDIINRFEESGIVGEEVDKIIANINSLTAVGTAQEMSAYMEPELQALEEQLANMRRQLADARVNLAEKKAQLEQAKTLLDKLDDVNGALAAAEVELQNAKDKLSSAGYDIQLGELETLTRLSDAKNQIANFETALNIAKSKADTIEEEFQAAKEKAESRLEEAEGQLNAAKNFLLDLESPKWYVQNRNDGLQGFEAYGQACTRTAALAIVFPWFFFLVAALVSLNTMTRMIDDERTQIGTLKAIGFKNGEIGKKYIFYALIASGIGGLAGSLMGFAVFPLIVSGAYNILFDVPQIKVGYDYFYATLGIVISVGVTVLSTAIALKKSLKIHPSVLMKPRAPKGGKRIALERFPRLWSAFSFNTKVMFRNVFRNKKRFFMAVLGVMGCTALMVAGFGLRHSTAETMNKQFLSSDSIWHYDMQAVINGNVDLNDGSKAGEILSQRSEIATFMHEYMKVYDTTSAKSDKQMETYIMVPEDESQINNYIAIRDEQKQELTLPQTGAIITQKLAQKLKLEIGDNIEVNLEDGYKIHVPVAGICENYCFHYMYMSREAYKAAFGVEPKFNYIAANFAMELSSEQKAEMSRELIENYDIAAVSYLEDIQSMFAHTMDSINIIVIILVISAGLLSLIVMINLSSMNINERVKEIATIKVLGFNAKETRNYIFRENLLLSFIGTFFGLIVGVFTHKGVILVGEVDILRYGRDAGVLAFVFAAALSIFFCLLVNLILTRSIKEVDMVESLKSNE